MKEPRDPLNPAKLMWLLVGLMAIALILAVVTLWTARADLAEVFAAGS